jgi:hypothetical protein
MKDMRFDFRASIVIVTATVFSGCSPENPTQPSLTIAPSKFSIAGPASVAPGGVLHYRGVLTGPSGATQDVTDKASWESDNPDLLGVSAPGVYEAAFRAGEATVRAIYEGSFKIAHVYVLDAGTIALHGQVRDGTLPIPGARIAVIAGAGSGRQTATDTSGAYSLVGVGGTATITVTLDGYETQTTTLNLSGNGVPVEFALDFGLTLVGGRPDISGAWALTFATSPSCTGLPAEATQRAYPLTISQNGASLKIVFTVPQSQWASFSIDGTLLGGTLTFTVPTDVIDGPWIVQTLNSGETFTLAGHATVAVSGGARQGHLDGPAQVYTTWPGVICDRPDHSLALVRTGS